MHEVEYEGTSYTVRDGETILRALLRQGARLNYSCGKGSCHTCLSRLVSGRVETVREVDPALADSGHFLPCISLPLERVVLGPPELEKLANPAEVVGRRLLADDILELDLAPSGLLVYEPGQHVHLANLEGLSRPYSITTLPDEDFLLRVHVRRIRGGAMSNWLFEHARPGVELRLRGPCGSCSYSRDLRGRPLLLLATGTGAGAMAAIARAALQAGHGAPVVLYHGGRRRTDLYLHETLLDLRRQHADFSYIPCLSQEDGSEGIRHGRITAHAFDDLPDLSGWEVFLCGHPAMVEQARCQALVNGVRRDRVHADPFDFANAQPVDDATRIAAIPADPELWSALGHGPGLTAILRDFYGRVFADPRLSPFFRGLDRDQVAARQYGFLADLISGRREYFGLNPFNAHHLMVIPDELFDYRESLFERVLRDHGLPEHLVRRFLALHERFRTSIVKSEPLPMRVKGLEIPLRRDSMERLDFDTICDSCHGEITAGTPARYHDLTGTLHCPQCAGLEADNAAPPHG